jgi:hypothetical protein
MQNANLKMDPYQMQMDALVSMVQQQEAASQRKSDLDTQGQVMQHLGSFMDVATKPVPTAAEIMAKSPPDQSSGVGNIFRSGAQALTSQGEKQYGDVLQRYKMQNEMATTLARIKQIEEDKKDKELERQYMGAKIQEITGKPGAEAAKQYKEDLQKKLEIESGLRKEIEGNPEVKQFMDVKNMYNNILSSSKNKSAASDMSLIFSYMKLLDPGSGVKEGEYANAQDSAGIPARIVNLYNRALTGGRLNDQQRNEFVQEATNIYSNRSKILEGRYNFYKDIASKNNLDLNNIIYNLTKSEITPSVQNTTTKINSARGGLIENAEAATIKVYQGKKYRQKLGTVGNKKEDWEVLE